MSVQLYGRAVKREKYAVLRSYYIVQRQTVRLGNSHSCFAIKESRRERISVHPRHDSPMPMSACAPFPHADGIGIGSTRRVAESASKAAHDWKSIQQRLDLLKIKQDVLRLVANWETVTPSRYRARLLERCDPA
ncbi:hypothetical protein MRB53_042017 [Persea americana]|nr:hypothetical protein MRB53_042017 [Persea americana]